MSAFDIAGAVVWTPMAILFWMAILSGEASKHTTDGGANFILGAAIVSALAAAFCIARLNGAHL